MKAKLKKTKEEIKTQTEMLFEIYKLGGVSVRNLAERYGIPWTTLRDRFKNKYGKIYTKYRADEGTVHGIIKEHMSKLKGEQLKEVTEWYKEHKQELLLMSLDDQLNPNSTKIYTEHRMDTETKAQCRLPYSLGDSPYLTGKYEPTIDGEEIDGDLPISWWAD